ncbi:hypothetical protein PV325_005594 [Microctonus aethiopoides]|nr:hypothetical protein PV325_005594 [Microctonus aethiopoides]
MSTGNDTKAFKRAEVNLQGQLKSYVLERYHHHYVPGLNLNKTPWVQQWNLENVMSLYRQYPHQCDLPKPLLPPTKLPRSVLADGDPATDILATKKYIDEDANRILDTFQAHQNKFTIQLKKDVSWTFKNDKMESNLPRYIADLADILEMDPDPHFEGKYNWYYTGGTLASVTFGGEFLLFFPYMEEMVAMPLCTKDNSIWNPVYKKAAKCSIKHPIYELRHNVTAQTCRILARCKTECAFYSITERDNKMSILEVDSQKSKTPFLSADLNSFDLNRYCTLKIDRALELWDMVSGKCIRKNTVKSTKCLDDEWGSVRYQTFNPNIIAFADRCSLHYLDVREPFEDPVLSMSPKSHLESCDDISLCIPSNRESRYYLGTTHSLLMCDDRSPEQCVHQKWTHQFKSPPLLGSTLMCSGQEYVIISSQVPSDVSIVINTWENYDDPHSYSLPHTPPCMMDTLMECQQLGKCLDPFLRSRLKLSTVGLQLLTNDSTHDAFIFLQNSIGDIFYQCITHCEDTENLPLINTHAYYALESWEHEILQQNRDIIPLVLTDQVNMKHVFDDFSNPALKYKLEPPEEIIFDSWKQSLDKLSSYVDILAPELLSAWEISEEGELAPQAAPHQKVLSWLEMSSPKLTENQSQEPQEESFVSLTPILSQELVSVSQQCRDVVEIVDNDIIEEPIYSATKMKTKRKGAKNKSSYVAGF